MTETPQKSDDLWHVVSVEQEVIADKDYSGSGMRGLRVHEGLPPVVLSIKPDLIIASLTDAETHNSVVSHKTTGRDSPTEHAEHAYTKDTKAQLAVWNATLDDREPGKCICHECGGSGLRSTIDDGAVPCPACAGTGDAWRRRGHLPLDGMWVSILIKETKKRDGGVSRMPMFRRYWVGWERDTALAFIIARQASNAGIALLPPTRSDDCRNAWRRQCEFFGLCQEQPFGRFPAVELATASPGEEYAVARAAAIDLATGSYGFTVQPWKDRGEVGPSPHGMSRASQLDQCSMKHWLEYDAELAMLGELPEALAIGQAAHLLLARYYRGYSTNAEIQAFRELRQAYRLEARRLLAAYVHQYGPGPCAMVPDDADAAVVAEAECPETSDDLVQVTW